MMAILWDFGRLLWVVIVLAAATWLPAVLIARRRRPPLIIVAEQSVVTVLIAAAATSLLSPAHLLNPFTLLLAYTCWPLGRWLVGHRRTLADDTIGLIRSAALSAVVRVDRAPALNAFTEQLRASARSARSGIDTLRDALTPARFVILAALAVTLAPRFAAALANTRLSSAAAYGELLAAQQVYAGESPWGIPRVAADLIAAISVVSSIAPLHVARLLVPIAAAVTLLWLMVAVRVITGTVGGVIVAVLTAAALAGRSAQTVSEQMAGTFVVLAVMLWSQSQQRSGTRWIAAGASVIAGLTAPPLLIVIGSAIALVSIAPSAVLVGTGATWIAVSWITHAGTPLGWALVAAGAAHLIAQRVMFERPPLRSAFAVAIVLLAPAMVIPRTASAHYVEYDAAARETVAITTQFPKYRWMIVAPIEEWAFVYGRGWHMNLHEFVDEVGARADEAAYRLPFKVDELFVFVETRPFAAFETEPPDVPFTTLIDPVYRNYRSPAGRSSLQFAAYQLCERLRQRTPGARIFFDDGRLKIYRFSLR